MEEKMISEKESLELITQMIRSAKKKLGKGAGDEFLIWGYSCVIASVVVLVLGAGFRVPQAGYGYFLIPVLGLLATIALKCAKRAEGSGQATTYIERSLKTLYTCLSLPFAVYAVIALFYYDTPGAWIGMFFLGAFVPAFCTFVTGCLLQIKSILSVSLVAVALSCAMLAGWMIALPVVRTYDVALGIIIWVLSLVVPGHILNYEAKKQSRDERA